MNTTHNSFFHYISPPKKFNNHPNEVPRFFEPIFKNKDLNKKTNNVGGGGVKKSLTRKKSTVFWKKNSFFKWLIVLFILYCQTKIKCIKNFYKKIMEQTGSKYIPIWNVETQHNTILTYPFHSALYWTLRKILISSV